MQKDLLIERLHNKSAVIGIIGLGYMGLPLMLCYANAGYKVIGFDIDENKINSLHQGKSYIEHIDSHLIEQVVHKQFIATNDFSKAMEADALIMCVPTPLNEYREPDLQYINNTVTSILPFLRKGQVISLESTSYPGTTEEEIQCPIEKQGFAVGKDIFVVYSPEREDPANKNYSTATIPKVLAGSTEACLEVGLALYRNVINKVIPASSLKTAEMSKLLENIHRAVNIGLVNEMKIVADRMGIDIHEVIELAASKPFGFVPYFPGPGIGGHCIPIDPFYLTWKARAYGVHTRFIELAGEINNAMPNWVVNKVIEGLNANNKAVKGSRMLILGLSYKKNVDDLRESPALTIISLLLEKGADIEYSDPHVSIFPKMRDYHFDMQSLALTASNLATFDCVILVTDHEKFDYDLIKNNSKLIIDTRGIYKGVHPNVIKA